MTKHADERFVIASARKIKALLEDNLLKNPDEAAAGIQEAKNIKRNLEQMGFLIKREAAFNPQTLVCTAEASVFKVKDKLTPEDAAIYSEWFMKRWGIKPPDSKGDDAQ